MFTFNIFEIYLFMVHKVSFACSPISKVRFKLKFFQLEYANKRRRLSPNEDRQEEGTNFVQVPQSYESYLLWSLQHPIQVFEMIKRYHMVGNITVIIHILFTLGLIHVFVKSVFFLYIGDDREALTYYKSHHYPHFAYNSKRPNDLNLAFFCFASLFLCCRVRNIFRLVRQAIINANSNEQLHVPQLNLAYMTTFNLTPSQWLNLWKSASDHKKVIRDDEEKYKNHIEFNSTVHEHLSEYWQKNYVYYFNLIDFEECYSGLDFIKNIHNRQKENYKTWHIAYPVDRLSLIDLRFIVVILVVISFDSLFGLSLSFSTVVYRDVLSYFPENSYPSYDDWVQIIPKHYASFTHITRALEICFLYFCMIPQYSIQSW